LIITVTDNGVGIPSDKMNNLMQEKLQNKESRLSGMGIRNVDERIRLYFGETYGISIQSVPTMFTTIEITIPITDQEDHNPYAQSTYSR
jgi:two-component system sensor histidine kinase YesM